MDLKKILGHIEGHDDLIAKINVELGQDFVPRTEFNAKNDELKTRDTELTTLKTQLDDLKTSSGTFEQTIAELTAQNAKHEKQALRDRIARETNLAADLVDRLRGDDEESLRADAKKLVQLVNGNNSMLPPLGDPELGRGPVDPLEAAYQSLANI